ncbi:DUF4355 domain-containing protein [Clostridium sp. D33t1_170424_F3]|uniref:DUF4355 domain-containing protein n=1 Tax=Clostridium sp. D33t1_170424_F3 TaxID=2787099 RepID=UPI0018A9B8D6|nr:DUF4355 domain-containing protein [Clostridium sp. D33t1_170424_F3]
MRIKRKTFLSIVRRWDGGGAGNAASAGSAEVTAGAEPTSTSAAADAGVTQGGAGEGAAAPNYDDLIKTDKGLQSWLDGRVNAATTTAVKNALEKERILADEKATEAEKLAKLSEGEKQEYLYKKAQNEIAQLKAQNAARELKDQAMKLAAEKKIPVTLAELLPYESMKADDVAARMDGLKAVYDQAVADGIAQALSGAGTPQAGGKPQGTSYTLEQLKGMSAEEINKNWDAVKASLEQKGR